MGLLRLVVQPIKNGFDCALYDGINKCVCLKEAEKEMREPQFLRNWNGVTASHSHFNFWALLLIKLDILFFLGKTTILIGKIYNNTIPISITDKKNIKFCRVEF
jgi:hypothetical protein